MSKRILSVILLICILVNNLPVAAFAEGTDSGCSHACDENCGYVAAVDCDKDCQPAEEGAELVHKEGCAFDAGSPCTHQHNGDCGVACTHAYAEGICAICGETEPQPQPCEHTYSQGTCSVCGEVCEHSYTEGVCTDCGMAEPAPTCDCTVKCAEGAVNESCQVCKTDLTQCGYTEPAPTCDCTVKCADTGSETCEVCKADPTKCAGEEPETEAHVITVSAWEWVENEDGVSIDREEDGTYVTDLPKVGSLEMVKSVLPAYIQVGETQVEITWKCEGFSEAAGTYMFTAILPEGYELAEDAAALTLKVNMGLAQMLNHTCTAANITFDTVLPGTLTNWTLPGGNYYLSPEGSTPANLTITGEVNLCLNGQSLVVEYLSISSGATLNLFDCTYSSSNNAITGTHVAYHTIEIAEGGTFNLHSGIVNHGKKQSAVKNDGTFTMNGGKLNGGTSQNENCVDNSGTFTLNSGLLTGTANDVTKGTVYNTGTIYMTGGEISGNKVSQGGGVYNKGTFTMTGGTIRDNEAKGSYNPYGGGVYNEGTFTMTGGTISECKSSRGGGVYNSVGSVTLEGTIDTCEATTSGGGVYNNSGASAILKGTINNCKATTGSGGGVCNSGTLDLYGTISNCFSCYRIGGGGVYNACENTTFTMHPGSSITGCYISNSGVTDDCYGAGVYSYNGTFIMRGSITGCTIKSTNYKGFGAGVALCGGTMIMQGSITNCKIFGYSNDSGAGIYRKGGTLYMSGSPVISGNKIVSTTRNVYGLITINDTYYPTSGASIGISYSSSPFTSENCWIYRNYFVPDDTNYYVDKTDNGALYLKSGATAVTAITLPEAISVIQNNTVALTATLTPTSANPQGLTWQITEGADKASVNAYGVITGIAPGTAKIVAKKGNITSNECTITVTAASFGVTVGQALANNSTLSVDGEELAADGDSIAPGKTVTMTVTYEENNNVITKYLPSVTYGNNQSVTLTPTAEDTTHKTHTYTFEMPASNIEITATIAPAYCVSSRVQPSNTGTVTILPTIAAKDETVTVKCTPADGYEFVSCDTADYMPSPSSLEDEDDSSSDTVTRIFEMGDCDTLVTVTFQKKITDVTLYADDSEEALDEGENLELAPQGTVILTAKLSPGDVGYRDITWTSSNPDVATVAAVAVECSSEDDTISGSGVIGYQVMVTAVKEGTATITAQTQNGTKAECTVTVLPLHSHSVGSTGAAVEWIPWDGKSPFPGGNVYLTADVNDSLTFTENTNLCLNSHSLTNKASQAIQVVNGATVTLCDCKGTGMVLANIGEGAAVAVMDGTFILESGTIQNSSGVAVNNRATFQMHGGTIQNSYIGARNGGTFTMTGGTITGNTYGVYVENAKTFNVSGSPSITGNTQANVYLTGVVGQQAKIRIPAQLNSVISLSMENPGTFFVYEGEDPCPATTDKFKSDSGEYKVSMSTSSGSNSYYTSFFLEGKLDFTVNNEDDSKGTVTATPKPAFAGEDVTVTVVPKEGWNVDKITVTIEGDGHSEPVTEVSNRTCTFKMPDTQGNVTVTVTYKEVVGIKTAPAAITGLTYTGAAQSLVTGGTAMSGTNSSLVIHYCVTATNQEPDWSNWDIWDTEIPTGKDAGTYYVWYMVVYESVAPYYSQEPVQVTISKAKPTGAVSAVENLTYNGEAQKLVTAGTVNGGTMMYRLNGTDWSTEIPEATAAGTYTVSWKVVGDSNHNNLEPATTVSVIAKAPLTVKANDHVITYGEAPANNGVTYQGFVNGETASVLAGSVVYSYSYQQGNGVGDNYTITPSGLTSGNYDFDYKPGVLKVTPKSITEADVTLYGSLTYTGNEQTQLITVANGITYEVSGNKATNAGNYQLTVQGTGNYTGQVTLNWSIAKAPLTDVSVAQYGTLTYTGKALTPVVTTAATAKGNQQVEFAYRISANDSYGSMPQFTNAGTYTVYYQATAANHAPATGDFLVTVGKQSVALPTVADKVYTGDRLTADLADTELYTVNQGENWINVGTYNVTLTLRDPGNYTWPGSNVAVATLPFNITKADATMTVPAPISSLVYDGDPKALVSAGSSQYGTFKYKLNDGGWGDTVPTATNAGTYTVYWQFTGDDNHKDIDERSVTVKIDKANIAPKVSIANWTYGDKANAPSVDVNPGKGTVVYYYEPAPTDNSTDVPTAAGNYVVTAVIPETDNYCGAKATAKFTIERKDLSIVANAKTKIYGENDPELTYTATGLVGEKDLEGELSRAAGENVGTYRIEQNTLKVVESVANNYNVTYTGADFKINQKPLTVTAKNHTIYFGDEAANDGVTYEGFITGEDEQKLGGELTYTYTYKKYDNVGSYKITPAGLTSSNYDIGFKEGTLTVDKKSLTPTVVLNPEFYTYDNTAKQPAVMVKDGNRVLPDSEYAVGYGDNTVVGVANVSVTNKDGGNYTILEKHAKFLILPDASALEGVTTANVTSANKADIEAILNSMKKDNTYIDVTAASDAAENAWNAIKSNAIALSNAIANAKTNSDSVTSETAKLPADIKDLKTSDLAEIEKILRDYAAIEGNLTQAEKDDLADEIEVLTEMKAAIDQTNKEIGDVTDLTVDFEKKDLVFDDKEDIEALKDQIADLKDNNPHLTDTDKNGLDALTERLEDLEEEFEAADTVSEQLKVLNTKAEPDDGNAVAAYEDAKKAYAELSDADKAKVDPAALKHLADMKATLTAYKIIKGDGAKHELGSSHGLTIVSNGYYPHFRYVKVNGREISSSNYTSASGSTIVTLKPEYVNRLMTGKYTITIGFGDADYIGEATANVQLYTDSGLPFTGDTIAMWIAMMAVSAGALIVVLVFAKKKFSSKK